MHRRRFLQTSLASLAAASLVGPSHLVLAQSCPPRTEPNIEGPFYRPHAPERSTLVEPAPLVLSGVVMDGRCRPFRDAVLEVWQADAEGEYDLHGDRFRGTLRTDAHGAYRLATIRPGRYRNGATYRPPHLHVKVHATGRPPLTTQLYFPNAPENEGDPWFRERLVIGFQPLGCHPGPRRARFDFVV